MPPARGELDALGGAFAPPECREHNMMTPMLFQYVVGLCCLRRDPEAVDVIIGDSVADAAAGIQRDVDVTITLREADGSLWAFKGYEVKRESQPLDVTIVEQLCMKFNDMPSVTHRAIVSASGYTKAAIAKAKTHKVHLYERADWTQPVSEIIPELERMGLPQHAFRFRTVTLYWRKPAAFLSVSEGPASFRWERSTPASDDHGNRHPQFENIGAYVDFVEGASSQILWTLDHIQRHVTPELRAAADHSDVVETPSWEHTHTLEVGRNGVFMSLHGALRKIEAVTISGSLYWQIRTRAPEFFVLREAESGEIFTGAAIAQGTRDDQFIALAFAPGSRQFQFRQITLAERHRNAIRRLSLLHASP